MELLVGDREQQMDALWSSLDKERVREEGKAGALQLNRTGFESRMPHILAVEYDLCKGFQLLRPLLPCL